METLFGYMLGNDEVAQRMEAFANENAVYFDYVPDPSQFEAAENKLVYTQIYNAYQAQFEAEINCFLSQMGWTVETLIDACQEQHAKEQQGRSSLFSVYDLLVSLSDYSVFKIMLLEQRKKQVEAALAQQQQ